MKSIGLSLFALSTVLVITLQVVKSKKVKSKSKRIRKTESTIDNFNKADDDSLSLFYDSNIQENGKGFPYEKTISAETINKLTKTYPEYKKLSLELYREVVEKLIICCVDIICQRESDNKLLLFYRRDAPASQIWWWPGGRMFRGETFYDTAIRKIKDETGNSNAVVSPVGIVSVWNTFFPDSNWDKERQEGREGTQTVNTTVVCRLQGDGKIEYNKSAGEAWAVEAHKWISIEEALNPGDYDKYVRLNVEKAIKLNLL